MHACIHADHVQVDEKPAKSRKKPACAPKSQPKVKKPALKQSEKAPSSKRQKTSKKDDSKSTRRSKASKRPAQSPQEDAPVKKPKAAGAKAAAVKSKPKAKATPPSEEPETVPDGGKVTRVRKPPVSAEPVQAVTTLEGGKKHEPAVAAGETQAPAVAPSVLPAEKKPDESLCAKEPAVPAAPNALKPPNSLRAQEPVVAAPLPDDLSQSQW